MSECLHIRRAVEQNATARRQAEQYCASAMEYRQRRSNSKRPSAKSAQCTCTLCRLLAACTVTFLVLAMLSLRTLDRGADADAMSKPAIDINVDNRYRVHLPSIAPLNERPYALVIYVRSAIGEFELRSLLRDTWIAEARERYPQVPVLFAVAKSRREEENERAHVENIIHEDILLFDFIDAYKNLSLKTYNVLHWHEQQRARAPAKTLLFWTNSDALVDVNLLIKLVESERVYEKNGTIYGQCSCSGACRGYLGYTPFRDPQDKWYTSWAVWPHERFPHYCISYATLFTSDVSAALLERVHARNNVVNGAMHLLRDFWIDDVLFTGVLAQEALLHLADRPDYFKGVPQQMTKEAIAVHLRTAEVDQVQTLWNKWQAMKPQQ